MSSIKIEWFWTQPTQIDFTYPNRLTSQNYNPIIFFSLMKENISWKSQEIVSGWNLFEFSIGRVLCFCPRECLQVQVWNGYTPPHIFLTHHPEYILIIFQMNYLSCGRFQCISEIITWANVLVGVKRGREKIGQSKWPCMTFEMERDRIQCSNVSSDLQAFDWSKIIIT